MKDPNSTNPSLIERVRFDDSKAWRELVDLYGPLVAFWCRKVGVREAQITDAVQDVFLAVLRTISSYEADPSKSGFRAWLWGVTRHKCVDLLRRENRHPEPKGGSTALQFSQQWADPCLLEEPLDGTELNHLLRRAMSQVENEFEGKTWQAFYRTTVDGVATAVVATELGLDPATVRQYRSRVLRRLRRQLGDQ